MDLIGSPFKGYVTERAEQCQTESIMSDLSSCFKAYDVRGRVPDELNEDAAYSIGRRAYAEFLRRCKAVVGQDIHKTSGA